MHNLRSLSFALPLLLFTSSCSSKLVATGKNYIWFHAPPNLNVALLPAVLPKPWRTNHLVFVTGSSVDAANRLTRPTPQTPPPTVLATRKIKATALTAVLPRSPLPVLPLVLQVPVCPGSCRRKDRASTATPLQPHHRLLVKVAMTTRAKSLSLLNPVLMLVVRSAASWNLLALDLPPRLSRATRKSRPQPTLLCHMTRCPARITRS